MLTSSKTFYSDYHQAIISLKYGPETFYKLQLRKFKLDLKYITWTFYFPFICIYILMNSIIDVEFFYLWKNHLFQRNEYKLIWIMHRYIKSFPYDYEAE